MIFEIENHRIPSHYDLHIKNFNSDELKFLIEYQYHRCCRDVEDAVPYGPKNACPGWDRRIVMLCFPAGHWCGLQA